MNKRQKVALVLDLVALVILWRALHADRPLAPVVWHHTARACRVGAFTLGWLAIEAENRYYRAVAP